MRTSEREGVRRRGVLINHSPLMRRSCCSRVISDGNHQVYIGVDMLNGELPMISLYDKSLLVFAQIGRISKET